MDSRKQSEAVDCLVDLFMSNYESPIDRKLKSVGELKARLDEEKKIIDGAGGSLDSYWVIRLFDSLEKITSDLLDAHIILSQSVDPDVLSGYVDGGLIDGVKKAQSHETVVQRGIAGSGNKKKDEFEEMKNWYKAWQKDSRIYLNQERYTEAMIDKTGLSRSTVKRNLKKIKEGS